MSLIVFLLFSIISSIPILVVFISSASLGVAFGPINKLPSAVGVTSTPLLNSLGTRNKVFLHNAPDILSSKQYSPFTPSISYLLSLTRLFIYAPPRPAAFIIN